MGCLEFETRIADWLDGHLPPGEAAVVERHVHACPGCAEFARQLRELDAVLVRTLKAPALPADFTARLRARIGTDTPSMSGSEARLAELKQQVQAEYEAQLARLKRRFKSVGSLLDVLGLGFLLAGAVTAAVLHAPKLVQFLPAQLQGSLDNPLLVGAGVGTMVLLAAAVAIWRRPGRLASFL